MKKVMLLGDSIRISYQEEVVKKLGKGYAVWGPEENCRFARYTLNSLRFWFEKYPHPDIIHWNSGLWDTAVLYPEDGRFTPIAEYLKDMKRILRELKKTGAKIIFATTTPVNPQKASHNNEDIIKYNRHIQAVMKSEGVPVNDLHKLVYANVEKYICEDHIHLTDAGKAVCGRAVAEAIKSLYSE